MQLPTQSELRKQSVLHFFGRALAMAVIAELVLSGIYIFVASIVFQLITNPGELRILDFYVMILLFVNMVTLPLALVTAIIVAGWLYAAAEPVDVRTAARIGSQAAMGNLLVLLGAFSILRPHWSGLLLLLVVLILCTPVLALLGWGWFQTGFMVIGLVSLVETWTQIRGDGEAWLGCGLAVIIPSMLYVACSAWSAGRLSQHVWLPQPVTSDAAHARA